METERRKEIPDEILFDILTRLPVKSLLKFRCVSKLWNSTISDPCFVKLHYKRSPGDLIISFPDELAQTLYITSSSSQNPDVLVVSEILSISGDVNWFRYVSDSENGLICLRVNSEMRICNPSTRQFITLPTTNKSNIKLPLRPSDNAQFGYDPINNEHKLLQTWVIRNSSIILRMVHRVFVFGVDGWFWKRIVDGPPHSPFSTHAVCINGVLYYIAWTGLNRIQVVVAFDVRLETFQFIQMPIAFSLREFSLIRFDVNFVALVDFQPLNYGSTVEIWIYEEPNWIYKTIDFSSAWTDMREDPDFYLSGTTRAGELILIPLKFIDNRFYLFFFNLKNATVRKLQIRGLPPHELRLRGGSRNINAVDHVHSILSPT